MGTRELRWSYLTPEDKKRYVRLLLSDGNSTSAVGAYLGTTKNAIVGFQHSYLPELTGRPPGEKSFIQQGRLEQLIRIEDGTVACEWPVPGGTLKGTVCGAKVEPGERFCTKHRTQLKQFAEGKK